MHLVLPHASALSPTVAHTIARLSLPNLQQLLARLTLVSQDEGDELALNTPHERVLARAWGWPMADGLLPFAAHWAAQDGLPAAPAGVGWGLLSPTHWHVGTEQISLTAPAALGLDEPQARTLFDSLSTLFADEDWSLHWGSATRWYACHPSLLSLPTASLDRVVGRNVDMWLNDHPMVKRIRRLQAEAQMLLYRHPVNEDREAAGLLPVNSFWLSGTGPALAEQVKNDSPQVEMRLRDPLLGDDGERWAAAWAAIDAGPLAELLAALASNPNATDLRLTLCGERHAVTLVPAARAWWQRGPLAPRGPSVASLLASL